MVVTTQRSPVGQPITAEEFDRFLGQIDDDLCINYELVRGRLYQNITEPSGKHQGIIHHLMFNLMLHFRQYFLPLEVQSRTVCRLSPEDKRRPDLVVIEKEIWDRETQRQAILESVPSLIIEVVSNHWQDDYSEKFELYQRAGVGEYWIFDPRLARARNPEIEVPTLSVCLLTDGKYQVRQYTEDRVLQSRLFPDLRISINQVLREARIL